MLGAIIGDIVGSRFEFDWKNHKSKDFEFFHEDCHFTDDSILTIAIAMALVSCKGDYSNLPEKAEIFLKSMANKYSLAGYGGMFIDWMTGNITGPYNSYGNGAAMRISPVAYVASSLDEVKKLSHDVTAVTHNHPEGIKGAEAVACAVFLALHGKTMYEIKRFICENYYNIDFRLDDIRDSYHMDESCQGSVPQALEAFFESKSFEDAIRNAVSIGGDSDTICAICGSVAEAYYGISDEMKEKAYGYLDPMLEAIVKDFGERYEKRPVHFRDLAFFWNCYQERFKTLWVTGEKGIGKTSALKTFASFVPDSYYYSFDSGIENFQKKYFGDGEVPKDWLADAVEKIAESHSLIILDKFSSVFSSWGSKLWPMLEVQRRIHKKKVLLVVVSRKPMVMYPLFSMMCFSGNYNRRICISRGRGGNSPDAEVYKSPHDALLSYSVLGSFPMGNNKFVYEDTHNYRDSIMHLLENRDFRISRLDEGKVSDEILDNPQHKDFLNRFIRDFHQKRPDVVTQEELEDYYSKHIEPYLDEYAKSICPPVLASMLAWAEKNQADNSNAGNDKPVVSCCGIPDGEACR